MKALILALLLITIPAMAQEFVNTVNIELILTADDAGSGVEFMQFSNDGDVWSAPETFNTLKTDWPILPGEGQRTIYVRFSDKAGNWSQSISTSFTIDTTPPSNTSIIYRIKVTSEGN